MLANEESQDMKENTTHEVLKYDEERAEYELELRRVENPTVKLAFDFNATGLVNIVFDMNVHRVITGMKKEKILNWKRICIFINRKMLAIIDRSINDDPDLYSKDKEPIPTSEVDATATATATSMSSTIDSEIDSIKHEIDVEAKNVSSDMRDGRSSYHFI
jgi:hypothetical protein